MTEEMIRMDLRANITPAELRKLRGIASTRLEALMIYDADYLAIQRAAGIKEPNSAIASDCVIERIENLRQAVATLEADKAELSTALNMVIVERNEANAKLDQALSQNEALRAQVDAYRQAHART